ncbi:PspC domain-containing protein [Candidatus Daviesbacteria bacterium]|nr:PspC domain-containing protein [Candidatus Daviesbacteria bacterium]
MPRQKSQPKDSKIITFPRLYRSETDRILGGVCGGLGEYFNLDPTLLRIIFVLLALFGGSGILLYLVLWLIVPTQSSSRILTEESIKENVEDIKNRAEKFAHDIRVSREKRGNENRMWFGFLIFLAGVLFLLSNYGIYDIGELRRLWPLLIILLGLFIIIRKS